MCKLAVLRIPRHIYMLIGLHLYSNMCSVHNTHVCEHLKYCIEVIYLLIRVLYIVYMYVYIGLSTSRCIIMHTIYHMYSALHYISMLICVLYECVYYLYCTQTYIYVLILVI